MLNNANWPQLPIAYENPQLRHRQHGAAHVQPDDWSCELTVGLNHGKKYRRAVDAWRTLERNDPYARRSRRFAVSSSRGANPRCIVPNGSSRIWRAWTTRPVAFRRGLRTCRHSASKDDTRSSARTTFGTRLVNMTKVMCSHNLKAGSSTSTLRVRPRASSQFNGSIQFRPQYRESPGTASVRERLHRFSEQLLEATSHPDAHAQFTNIEWFIQDNWRVQPNFTLDGGIRLSIASGHRGVAAISAISN